MGHFSGSLRDGVEEKLEETKKRHETELEELADEFGVASSSVAAVEQEKSIDEGPYFFSERNWSSLGKKELEVEAVKRGLSKKGNREELVTKLVIFHTDQKKKVENGELDPKNIPPEPKKKGRQVIESSSDEEKPSPVDPSKVGCQRRRSRRCFCSVSEEDGFREKEGGCFER